MRRKSLLWIGFVILAILGGGAVVALLLKHEPEFYRHKAIAAGQLREKHSQAFTRAVTQLWNGINNNREQWGAEFTETQINSYLAEHFVTSNVAEASLPKGVRDPRIAIEGDRIRLGFRYGTDPWSVVVSADFRVWMARKENNTVVLQLEGIYAGALPLSSKLVMDEITRLFKSQLESAEIRWYRHEGKLTAAVHFGGTSPRPTHQLQELRVGEGKIVIAGRSIPDLPPQVLTGTQ